jgi:hypothetical protein
MLPVIDEHSHIEDIIKAIRYRMLSGLSMEQIARDLGRFISQEDIYICYHAAKILNEDWSR